MDTQSVIIMHAIYSYHLNDVECTVRGLVETEDLPQQTVSNAVAALRAEGLVSEKVDPDDGRIKLLCPTIVALKRRIRVWSEAIGLSPIDNK